jgi:tRNA splicing ligase
LIKKKREEIKHIIYGLARGRPEIVRGYLKKRDQVIRRALKNREEFDAINLKEFDEFMKRNTTESVHALTADQIEPLKLKFYLEKKDDSETMEDHLIGAGPSKQTLK